MRTERITEAYGAMPAIQPPAQETKNELLTKLWEQKKRDLERERRITIMTAVLSLATAVFSIPPLQPDAGWFLMVIGVVLAGLMVYPVFHPSVGDGELVKEQLRTISRLVVKMSREAYGEALTTANAAPLESHLEEWEQGKNDEFDEILRRFM